MDPKASVMLPTTPQRLTKRHLKAFRYSATEQPYDIESLVFLILFSHLYGRGEIEMESYDFCKSVI